MKISSRLFLFTFIFVYGISGSLCINLFAKAVTDVQKKLPSCKKIVDDLTLRSPQLDSVFKYSDLYFTSLTEVCENQKLVVTNSNKLVKSCRFPPIVDENDDPRSRKLYWIIKCFM